MKQVLLGDIQDMFRIIQIQVEEKIHSDLVRSFVVEVNPGYIQVNFHSVQKVNQTYPILSKN